MLLYRDSILNTAASAVYQLPITHYPYEALFFFRNKLSKLVGIQGGEAEYLLFE